MLLKAANLKGIARNGVGYDCIDKPTAFERGIAVMNVPGSHLPLPLTSLCLLPLCLPFHLTRLILRVGKNAEAVAEQALTLALVLLRRTAELDRRLRNGENIGTGAMGNSLRGKRIGIVGMGAIARRSAELFWVSPSSPLRLTCLSLPEKNN
jgi:D-3-phosphoglycerate dehydrogenase